MAEAAVERPIPLERFYCHSCSKEITPNLPDYTCPDCADGFVEQISDEEELSQSSHEDSLSTNDMSELHTTMQEMRNFMYHIPFSPFFDEGGSETMGQSDGAPTVISIRQNPGRIRIDRGPQQRNIQMQGLVNYFLSQLTQMDPGMPNGRMFQLHGNPEDYAWGAHGLDSIISQLLNQLEGSGAPPASEEKIAKLPLVKINQSQVDERLQCSICMDDYKLDEEVHKLPCEHYYHPQCIIPWLKLHGTCPVCRKDLNGEVVPIKEDYDGDEAGV